MATAEINKTLDQVYEIVPHFIQMPSRKMRMDYDEGADVLYINFEKLQRATDSEMLENGVLLRYKDSELVGITIMDASKR